MKTALIIGAGPAGLTAAYELLTRTDIIPIVVEADKQVGGLSRTIDHHGNKIDIGGHRFFSKSSRVVEWWQRFLPLEAGHEAAYVRTQYHNQTADVPWQRTSSDQDDNVMLVRRRKSRIYYQRKLFEYPLRLNVRTLHQLGIFKSVRILTSYVYAKVFPRRPEQSLEDFFVNRFGNELYATFFRDYTEKVWGVPCNQLPASWGQQRVKNLDVTRLMVHAVRSFFSRNKRIDQKGTSTSLIEQFLYPKFGPGQMWERVAAEVTRLGGQILLEHRVNGITASGVRRLVSATLTDSATGQVKEQTADYFFSTMPVKELLDHTHGLTVPETVKKIAGQLKYRDFLIVGILTEQLSLTEPDQSPVTDNWIYIQDKHLRAGRLQFFHNWSPYMVARPGNNWIGVEYFCDETDAFWQQPDADLSAFAVQEMQSIGVLHAGKVIDSVVIRVKKAYPSYFGSYEQFPTVQAYLDTIDNLFPIGRNGMHRYNNSDHSMLTAMTAVDNILAGRTDKSNLWAINTEEEYHEKK